MSRRSLALIGLLAALAFPPTASAQDVIFIVRHAEKQPPPPSGPAPANPPLSTDGMQRAEALKKLLGDAGVKAIIVSPSLRTQQTAAPLSTALSLTPDIDPMTDPKALVGKLRTLGGGGNVLVVGHTNTIPALLKELGHPDAVVINEDDYDNLFVVTPGQVTRARVTRLHYKR